MWDKPEPELMSRFIARDDRGYFTRIFQNDYGFMDLDRPQGQINVSRSADRGTVRGLHFQTAPFNEAKTVTCLSGAVFDVVVDLRPTSPNFGSVQSYELTEDNGATLLIPRGFAHGFQTLTEDVRLLYMHEQPYAAEHQGRIRPVDGGIKVDWPLEVSLLSPADAGAPAFDELDFGDLL